MKDIIAKVFNVENTTIGVAAVLAPVHGIMLAVGALIFIDLFTGIWRAWKVKEKITSNGLRRTITKMVAYQLGIVTALILEKYLMTGVPMIQIVAGIIGVTEAKSVFENITVITGIDFLSVIKDKLQGKKEVDKQ